MVEFRAMPESFQGSNYLEENADDIKCDRNTVYNNILETGDTSQSEGTCSQPTVTVRPKRGTVHSNFF